MAAAFLFGASAPVSKLLLREIEPTLLAGLLYLGSGVGLLLFMIIRKSTNGAGETEAKLARAEIPWLAAAILSGGVAAPIILLFSLRNTPAAAPRRPSLPRRNGPIFLRRRPGIPREPAPA